ncbi:MAG: 1-(5-phosphoribosyl)-5-[(5-phosphoribosylamino)methylideneamino] imidazole-4-carboxamide isomerase [Nanoarchaeota archaeon]
MIYPCIDLMDGKVVQLVQGKAENKKVEIDDYNEMLSKFEGFEIQVIDLDAAMGKGNNYSLIREIASKTKIRVGGGVRTKEDVEKILSLGVTKVVVGSPCFKKFDGKFEIDLEFLDSIKQYKDQIIIAIDSIEGEIVINGWKVKTGIKVVDAVKQLEPYCSEFLATYVDKEGMMQGTDLDLYRDLRNLTKNRITAAGGISTLDEINQLDQMGVDSALGMAIYSGHLKISDLKEISYNQENI